MLTMTVASVNSTIFIMEASLTHLDWEIGLLECSQMSPLSLTNVKTCSAYSCISYRKHFLHYDNDDKKDDAN